MTSEMDKQTIEQHGIAEKYLHGRLSPEETIAFEQYLMENPQMVEQLEIDSLLIRAMPAAIKTSQPSADSKGISRFWSFLQNPLTASFATFVLCLIALPLLLNITEQSADKPITNIPDVYLAPTRGETEHLPTITIKPTDRYFQLIIQPENITATRFAVSITHVDSNKLVLKSLEVDVMPNGDIKLMLPAGDYVSGRYVVNARVVDGGDGKGGAAERFGFDINRD